MDKQKASLVDAYCRLGLAQLDLLKAATSVGEQTDAQTDAPTDAAVTSTSSGAVTLDDVDHTLAQLRKWADLTDTKVAQFVLHHAIAHKHYGRAIKVLQKLNDDKKTKDNDRQIIELYKSLGWTHSSRRAQNQLLTEYPAAYRPF